METDLTQALHEASQERKAAETARTELAKAQLRLEALPRIEAETDPLRSELDTERLERAEANQATAVSQAKLEAAAEQCKKAEAQVQLQGIQAENANKRAQEAAEALGNGELSTQTLKARLEAATRDLDDAPKETAGARSAAQKSEEEVAELRGKLASAAER